MKSGVYVFGPVLSRTPHLSSRISTICKHTYKWRSDKLYLEWEYFNEHRFIGTYLKD